MKTGSIIISGSIDVFGGFCFLGEPPGSVRFYLKLFLEAPGKVRGFFFSPDLAELWVKFNVPFPSMGFSSRVEFKIFYFL